MHQSAIDHIRDLADRYLDAPERPGRLAHGICPEDDGGACRRIFQTRGWIYRCLAFEDGPDVDTVLADPYDFAQALEPPDLVLCGAVLARVEFFWRFWSEIVRGLAPRGLIFLVVPSRGPDRRDPVDCWRFREDACEALAQWGELTLLSASTDHAPHPDPDSAQWGDTVAVFMKPPAGAGET
jgi:hypothetical protein